MATFVGSISEFKPDTEFEGLLRGNGTLFVDQ